MKRTLLVLLVVAALLGGGTVSTDAQESAAGPTSVWDLIARLRVAGESRDGYTAAQFGPWADADHDGCDTRAEVLLDEAVVAPVRTTPCTLTGGTWHSYYDNTTVDGRTGLTVDHLVPLAEAWDSGASEWDRARRQDYANDLNYPRTLVAVSTRSIRSKADQDPATWLPSASGARCHYLDDWVAVKTRWNLATDPAEQAALERLVRHCPDVMLDVPLA